MNVHTTTPTTPTAEIPLAVLVDVLTARAKDEGVSGKWGARYDDADPTIRVITCDGTDILRVGKDWTIRA